MPSERAYNLLQSEPLKKLVATYFGGLEDNLGLAANLPVDGLHIDLVRAPEQYPSILDRLPAYKVVSLGLVNGRNVWRCDLEKPWRWCAMPGSAWASGCGSRRPARCCTARWTWNAKTGWTPS